ncbi:olfactory receptor 5AR1-like [Hyperolius riggenbachi]|uniref:olfactory receptor 5AR1-like n=1 Tax=Hyperolius riggenbachi TaxID=752182 RepID=UPI0035A3B7AC
MSNITRVALLILVGLSDHPPTMNGLFVVFLLIYVMTVVINLLIFFLVITDSHLHNPMYFFLSNLAFLDMSYSSVTAPKMLFDLITKYQAITIPACIVQVFFFLSFASSELFLLSVMSYDRFVAICRPLHYTQIMSWRVCAHMVSVVWVMGFICGLFQTLFLPRLSFCGLNLIHNFFCDLPNLFEITCTDTTINIVALFTLGGSLGVGAFAFTFLPYVRIFSTILRIRSNTGRLKAFSTCSSHLTVVSIFYGSIIFIYFVPATRNMLVMHKLFSVIYSIINPLLNPLIYSLRNKDLKAALMRSVSHLKLHKL